MALSNDGLVFSWGLGDEGQLGHGNYLTISSPLQVDFKGSKIHSISCGHSHSGAITEEGHLYLWGCNFDFRLMLDENKNQNRPAFSCINSQLGKHYVCRASLGVNHTAVVTSDYRVFTGGLGNNGQLGVNLGQLKTSEVRGLCLND